MKCLTMRRLAQEEETLTEEELARVRAGEAEIERGGSGTQDDVRRR